MNFAFAKYMNSKVCQFTELCEKKHKSEVKKWNKTSHFYEEMLTYCFGLHWHSVQLKLLKQHENMAFLFLISRAGPSSYLFIIISITSVKISILEAETLRGRLQTMFTR